MTTLRTVADGFSFLEGPRWHDGRLWVSDFFTERVVAISDDGDIEEIVSVPQRPSGLGWLPDGRLLVVSMLDRKLLSVADGVPVEYADLSGVATSNTNDMVVDVQGRAYVGNFGFPLGEREATYRTADLALVQPDGSVSVAATGLHFPNGMMITPDGGTLIVCESFGNRISAYDVAADGSLGERRDWAVFGEQPTEGSALRDLAPQRVVAPDGACLDAEGAVWTADAAGKRVLRVAEGGEVLEQIETPTGVFACMLGGDEGRTLYLCCAPDSDASRRAAAREAALMACEVGVPHAGLP